MPSRAGCFMVCSYSPSLSHAFPLQPRVQIYLFNSFVGVVVGLIETFGVHT